MCLLQPVDRHVVFTGHLTGGIYTMRIQSKLMAGETTASLVIIASTLFLSGTVPGGSIVTTDPGLSAVWNPVTFHDTCEADLLTGLLTGVFTFTFANGDTLSGSIFEDVSAVLPTQSGP